MRRATALLAALILVGHALGQTQPPPAPYTASTPPAAAEPAWSFAASAYTYFVPGDRDYVQPTFTADRDWLHLELRYNYEAIDTGSLWLGYNFSGGDELAFEIKPMLGVVFGDNSGIAPGYKGSLGWRRFELYSEGEYVIDTGNGSDFFYNWSELTFAPVDALRFGVVTQRTRLYQSDREIQRGLLLGFTGKRLDFTGYVFNLDEAKPIVVFSVGLSF
jgi:hypothetical protein